MWVKGSKIPISEITDELFIIKFNCGLCKGENSMEFFGLFPEFLQKRPKYVWSTVEGCPQCDKTNYHQVTISKNKEYLTIDIRSEGIDIDKPSDVKQESIFYSTDIKDKPEWCFEIPLEFEFIDVILDSDAYLNYVDSVAEIKSLMLRRKEILDEKIIRKIIYSNVFSALETYLFDLIINAVHKDEKYLRRAVEDHQIFAKEKIDRKDIFTAYGAIKMDVIKELQKIVYHNLTIVIPLFKNVLHIDFSTKIRDLPEAIKIRHDIVHRNGKDVDGNFHDITIDKINELIKVVDEIVEFINNECKRLGII